jgi:hypothetical protein
MKVLSEKERERHVRNKERGRRVRNKEKGMGEKKERIYMRGDRDII